MRCHLYSLITTGLLLYSVAEQVRAAAIDCTPLRPDAPADSRIEDTVKAQANILFRSLGSGAIENGYRQVASDTLAHYPNADKLLLWREYIYVSCTLLSSSPHWSDNDKWDKWMQLMNRWSDAPPAGGSAPEPPPTSPAPSSALARAASAATPSVARLAIGGVRLGTTLGQIQARKDISLSLDSDGNPYGEEIFTFAYGSSPGARQLDGDVLFGLRGGMVSSMTVTHTLGSTGCADNASAAVILDEQLHDWGTPLRRTVSSSAGSVTVSYAFRRDATDMALILRTSSDATGTPFCRVSMNYQRSTAP